MLQNGSDAGRVIFGDRLFKYGHPFPQCLHRRFVRLIRHDAGNADVDRRFLGRDQDLVESFSWTHPGENDLDVVSRTSAVPLGLMLIVFLETQSQMNCPVPTKVELEINMRAARTLGLDVPTSVLLRADGSIEM